MGGLVAGHHPVCHLGALPGFGKTEGRQGLLWPPRLGMVGLTPSCTSLVPLFPARLPRPVLVPVVGSGA